MTDALAETVAAVSRRVDPGPTERERLESVAEDVLERTAEAISSLPVQADVVRVGSTARDTWTPDDRDIDVFIRFSPSLPREDLEEYGLRIGREVLPAGREEYAEHPYVTGTVDGYDVDLVPCYRVESASAAKSAVDRTPFHTRYVAERLDPELAAEVRVLKQFLRGCGIYGSDLRTKGFSGYLTELLVLEFDGFVPTIRAAAGWQPPVVIDPADHGETRFDDPLVVVDPTDPDRNVAAVLSATNVARFQHHARALIAGPTVDRFFPDEPNPLDPSTLRSHLDDRGTTAVALRFRPPNLVEDQLYPQLDKSVRGLARALERTGFSVLRTDRFAADGTDAGETDAVLLFELERGELPAIERHEGPPVAVRDHAESFYEKYANEPVYGPFIDGERYVVERWRGATSVAAFLESDAIFEAALGADVERTLRHRYEVLVDEELVELISESSYARRLARYFDPQP